MTLLKDTRTRHKFIPTFHVIDSVAAPLRGMDLSQEVMFYQSSMDFVQEYGGPIAREFIRKLPFSPLDNVLVDLRVHHLNIGHYPAIPGYHLDWLPRTNKGADPVVSSIPSYDHVVLIIGETSLTEFVSEPIVLLLPERRAFEYANDTIKDSGIATEHVTSGTMVQFTSRDWHRPTPAEGPEWRLLIRASRIAHKSPVNDIRTQAQVYIPVQEASW